MVYVWGSNSSHQLAEGTLEKILLPKLTQGFSDAQMVRLLKSVELTLINSFLLFIKVVSHLLLRYQLFSSVIENDPPYKQKVTIECLQILVLISLVKFIVYVYC